ncbi:hypothetical protein A9P82_04400 [Arachidicoccus ginsenosidimutans]|uniref:DUF1573 domain-containing protein n=1 Tax=Arachidicoccus sp. BS20 TaxID=1850526 RepID=UPI0007F06429|nr:DUF1573 domain-containing protein [Arachidicoccus sp. BS20]ANI88595.1 hypothetical protein A9P82_04400 [Arachidicoccus sp. BS20]
MKKIIFAVLFICAGATATMAQEKEQNTPVPQAKFSELRHQFGNIPQGVPATTIFTFENKGKTPLVIETATATCGCTTPVYPKKPILAGKKGEIKVTYNAAAVGHFVRSVDVKFAQAQRPVNLSIEGTVDEKK